MVPGPSSRGRSRWRRRALLAALALAALVWTLPALAQGGRDPVAILDLDALGVSREEVQILSEHYRNLVFEAGSYEVVARDRTDRILGELRLQRSGVVDEATAVEAGRLLGVRKIFFGSLGRLGQTYSIHLQLVDVKSGKVEADRTGQYRCRPDELPGALSGVFSSLFAPSQRPRPPRASAGDPPPPVAYAPPGSAARPAQPAEGPWRVLFGTYSSQGNAADRAGYLTSEGYQARVYCNREDGADVFYVLYARGFPGKSEAEATASMMRRQGHSVQVIMVQP